MSRDYAGNLETLRPDARRAAFRDDANRFRTTIPGDGWSPLWSGLARVGGVLPPAGVADADPWALLRGRGDASGGGRADGSIVGTLGSRIAFVGPRFDVLVPPTGYAWWYVDAISEDGAYGLTIIGFVGSVFSPYYKASGRGDPENHASINVALYGPRGSRWCMTERPRTRLTRTEVDQGGEGDTPVLAARLSFEVSYWTKPVIDDGVLPLQVLVSWVPEIGVSHEHSYQPVGTHYREPSA